MIGYVDDWGRALLPVTMSSPRTGRSAEWSVWIDTGFTGDLVVPRPMIDELQLEPALTGDATLADGSSVAIELFSGILEWFERRLIVEVVASDNQIPLLGVRLLVSRKLSIDYPARTVALD